MTRYFFDENFPYRIARAVAAFEEDNVEVKVELHQDHFEKGTKDTVWLAALGQWNPVPTVICGDGRIIRNPLERAALREANLTFVVLANRFPNLPLDDQHAKFSGVWSKIRNLRDRQPTIYMVGVNGKLEKKHATRDLEVRK